MRRGYFNNFFKPRKLLSFKLYHVFCPLKTKSLTKRTFILVSKAIFKLSIALFSIHYSVVMPSLLKFKDPIHFAPPNHLGFTFVVMYNI